MNKNVLILMDDVHLEGRPDNMRLDFAKIINNKVSQIKSNGDKPIVICAGDIGEGTEGVKWASQFECDVIYICGNHEFWSGDFYEVPKNIKDFVSQSSNSHIKFLDKEGVIINGLRFLGATLWTGLGNYLPWYNKNYVIKYFGAMGDFKKCTAKNWYTTPNITRLKNFLSQNGVEDEKIKYFIENKLYNPLIEIEENKKAIQFFVQELSAPYSGETIVISHHLPVYDLWMKKMGMNEFSISGEMTNNERFVLDCAKGSSHPTKDLLKMAFYANDLKELMYSKYSPSYWLHGHLHIAMEDIVGKTKVISSPVGYVKQSEEMKFKEIIIGDHNIFVAEYVKKEIENYNWSEKLYDTLRNLEKFITKYEIAVNVGVANSIDFAPVLKIFQQTHEKNLNNLKQQINEWFKLFLYISKPNIIEKEIDFYLVKKSLNLDENKFKIPEVLAAGINETSFLTEEKFKQQNIEQLQFYHYREWLKELQKIQIQIHQLKKNLLEYCEEFKNK